MVELVREETRKNLNDLDKLRWPAAGVMFSIYMILVPLYTGAGTSRAPAFTVR